MDFDYTLEWTRRGDIIPEAGKDFIKYLLMRANTFRGRFMKPSGPLLGTRVLDLSGASGLHCSKLFADLGADVIKIERPGGDSTRNIPPFKDDQPSINNSLYFLLHMHL